LSLRIIPTSAVRLDCKHLARDLLEVDSQQQEDTMAETAEAVREIEREELKGKLDRGERFVLLETLAPEHFRHAHLPGALNMPPDRVKELAPVLVPDKQTEVVTYCTGPTCQASIEAARQLSALGYRHVEHYAGGKADWTKAGLPVERAE
jgi:rhodanese-related sulfurtransferase